MAPPVETFPTTQLPSRVQVTVGNKLKKKRVNLDDCELLEMLQYQCAPDKVDRTIKCREVERLFRRLVESKSDGQLGWTVMLIFDNADVQTA